jgi:hypothetical protein
MRRSESGKATFKTLVSVLFLLAVIYSGIKIIPVYVNNYELEDYIRQQTPFWLAQRTPGDAIRSNIVAKAQELSLPVSSEQVKVQAGRALVSISIDYTVPVDLLVYTLRLHFTPAAENRSLT